jgi:hypothetical protein
MDRSNRELGADNKDDGPFLLYSASPHKSFHRNLIFPNRKCKREHGSVANLAVDPNSSAVGFNDAAGNSQAHPRATGGIAIQMRTSVEFLEDAIKFISLYARSMVLYTDQQLVTFQACAYENLTWQVSISPRSRQDA